MKPIYPKFYGTIDNLGELHIKDIIKYKQYLMGLKGEIELVIKKKSNRKYRSNQENAYYNGCILPMVAKFMSGYDTPLEREAAHNALKMLFLRDDSKRLGTIRSTADLSTVEFEAYMTNIRMYMSQEFSLYLPLPNEYSY